MLSRLASAGRIEPPPQHHFPVTSILQLVRQQFHRAHLMRWRDDCTAGRRGVPMSSSVRPLNTSRSNVTIARGIVGVLMLCLSSLAMSAQGNRNAQGDRNFGDRNQADRNWDGQRFTRLEPGMTIRVRTTEPIDAARADYRVFNGIVEEDVRGDNGR